MSFVSKGHSINCNSVTLGGIYANSSNSIDIRHSDPSKKILINGVEPSAGGGGGVTDPLNLNNINAAVAMTTPSITPPAGGGGLVIRANGLQPPAGAGETLNISASTIETVDGDISTSGSGSLRVQGTGFISCGTTITANGNITTGVSADIYTGRNFIFNGQDIYKAYPNVVPQPPNQTYKDYKGLVATSDNAIFTAEPVFRKTIKVQTSDGAVPPVLTDQITLNSNGTIQCANINNVNEITTGTVVCDNGGTNECKARVFNTRTSGTNGWTIKQALEDANPPGNAANNILQFAATQAQAAGIPTQIYVTASDYDPTQGDSPSVIIDPATTASGGRVQASQFITGTTGSRFVLKQDVGGPLNQVLQVNAPSGTAEVQFRDNVGGETLTVKNASVDLGNTIPLNFGALSFRPVELVLNFTGATLDANPSAIFNSASTNFTRTNDGASVTLNSQGEAVYHLTIDAGSSSGGTVGSSRFMCNFPYMVSANASGQFVFTGNYCMNTTPPAGFDSPVIEGDGTGGPVGSTNYSWAFPSVTGTETFNGTIRITALNY